MQASIHHEILYEVGLPAEGALITVGPPRADRVTVRVEGPEGSKCLFDAALHELGRIEGRGVVGPRISETRTEHLYDRAVEVVRQYAIEDE